MMGQKTNVVGTRIGNRLSWKSSWNVEKNYYTNTFLKDLETRNLLAFFLETLGLNVNNLMISFWKKSYTLSGRIVSISDFLNFRGKQKNISEVNRKKYYKRTRNVFKHLTPLMDSMNINLLEKEPYFCDFFFVVFNKISNKIGRTNENKYIIKYPVCFSLISEIKHSKISYNSIIKNTTQTFIINFEKEFLDLFNSLEPVYNKDTFIVLLKSGKRLRISEPLYKRLIKNGLVTSNLNLKNENVKNKMPGIFIPISSQVIANMISYQTGLTTRLKNKGFNTSIKKGILEIIKVIFNKRTMPYISGIKIICSGRWQRTKSSRKQRMSYSFGKIKRQTISKVIDYGFSYVTTKFGVCGIKVWVSYKIDI